MIRGLAIGLFLALAAIAHGDGPPLPPVLTDELPSPAAPGATCPSLFTARDGMVWLSWVEPGKSAASTLRFATLEAAAKRWSAPRTIASDATVTTNPMDFPQLAVTSTGRVAAIWTDGHGGARLSESRDRGATWSAPASFPQNGDDVEKFSLTVLADDRILVAWLDGRAKKSGGKTTQLYSRVLGDAGPDQLVDPSVCDCCQTALTSFLDGGALVAYRGRTEEDIRDIRTARFAGRAWQAPRPLNNDGWRINACPVNGPKLASDGGRVSAAWFTAADNEPRVLASYSPDAGTRFLQPLRLDRGHPTGHVDTLILRDGTLLVTWLESDGGVWLRRVAPDFAAGEPFPLAAAGAVSSKNFPRIALVHNYGGGAGTAQFVAAFAGDGKSAALRTVLVTVREGELLASAKDCDCMPTPEQLAGFSMRGTATAADAARNVLSVRHEEIPGVMAAGMHEFRVAPNILSAGATGRQFLGRIERRDGAWWLFDMRLIAAPAEQK